jgi:hypothetical protein
MTFQDLLDELRQNILRDRSDIVSGPSDQIWSDETLIRYINDGYRRFCRRTLLLRDGSTPQFTQINIREGQTLYELDPVVLAVLSARYEDDENDLPRAAHEDLNTMPYTDPLLWDVNMLSTSQPGRPRAFTTDESVTAGSQTLTHVRVYPTPTSLETGKTLYLRVARLPAEMITLSNLCNEPEVSEDYHLDILNWAAFRALSNHDVDGDSKDRAATFKAAFEAVLEEAEQEAKRRMFSTTRFMPGRFGFSWARNSN